MPVAGILIFLAVWQAGVTLYQVPAYLLPSNTWFCCPVPWFGYVLFPNRDLRDAQALSAFFIAPAIDRESIGALMSTHPPLQQRLDQLAKVGAELSEPA